MGRPLIFLSHSGEDTQAAKELARLLGQAGLDVWLDVERLKPGDRWGQQIEEGLRQATALVVYVGKSGVRHWVDQEVRVALDRSTKEQDFRLIPVLGAGANPKDLPLFLTQYHWLDLREGWSDAAQLKALIESATRRPAEGVSLLPPGKPPFRGLQFFDVEDSLLFFGRDAEIQDLRDKLRADSFLAVVGDSGSGKSSLVRAGLIPALHRGPFHDGKGWVESWRVAITRPGEDPFGELAKALLDLNPQMSPAERLHFLDGLKEKILARDGLDNAIAALVPRGTRTLLVIDQFEELFTLTRGLDPDTEKVAAAKRRAYVDSLLAAAKFEAERPVYVLITLRADFYSRCWEHPDLTPRMGTNQYNVRRASADRLRKVIEKPLALAGAKAQSGLVDAILSDVGDEPGNLPLLEHALSQLWDKRKGLEITHDAYKEIGRLSGALRNHADQVFEELTVAQQDLAERIFLDLTQLGERSEDTRRRVKKTDLPGADSKESEKVLRALTKARLVVVGKVVDESGTEDETVEVAHEALIRDWPRLQGWLKKSREELRQERRLADKAAEWESARHPDRLLRGEMLEEALKWARHKQPPPPDAILEFLTAGLEEIIVVDKATDLMWTRRDNGEDINWNDANEYAKRLRLGGHSDWRLPTIDELKKLYDPKSGNQYNIREPFRLSGRWLWSSTTEGSDSAWYFTFRDGKRYSFHMVNSPYFRALCVRRSGE